MENINKQLVAMGINDLNLVKNLIDTLIKNKIKNELTSILKFRPAENYLNLKIRQRYWVMFFMEQFKNQLETLDNLILLEMELN